MIFRATIELFIDAESEAGASDAVGEILREHLRAYASKSSLIDWQFFGGSAKMGVSEATSDDIDGLEFEIDGTRK